MDPVDPFWVFRTGIFFVLGVYTILVTTVTIFKIAHLLRGRDPRKALLRAYLSYQLVTIRLRPLAADLLEIALWLVVLFGIWRLERAIA